MRKRKIVILAVLTFVIALNREKLTKEKQLALGT